MYLLNFLAFLAVLVVLVFAQELSNSTNAPITENNPARVTFQAVFQADKPVQGQITGVSNDNGTGVNFNVNFFSFPDVSIGPFNYHVHEYPIPTSGNCTAAGGHLSPFGRTDTPPCDPINPDTCQPGDLSGKHGNISQLASASGNDGGANVAAVQTFQAMYLELYLSTDPNNAAFFGNRSVVVHAANGTRLNCANFTQQLPSETFGNGNTSTTANATTTTTTSTPTHNGAVSGLEVIKMQASLALGVVALVAFTLF